MDSSRFEHLQRVAKIFASSKLVPDFFQGNLSDCIIACQMAMRLDVDPMMLMQNTYIINGKPGMEAKLVIALMNSRGPFTGPVQFRLEGEGADRKCTAYATHKATGAVCSSTVTWKMVQAEGWDKAKGSQKSKWMTIPDQMFSYRAAAFLARLYCPEVLMGLKTADELEDIGQTIDVTPEAAPLEIPISVKEADDAGHATEPDGADEGATGTGSKSDASEQVRSEPDSSVGSRTDEPSLAGGGEAGSGREDGQLFDEPSAAEQAEIEAQERGEHGAP